jgi:hypothetical protein
MPKSRLLDRRDFVRRSAQGAAAAAFIGSLSGGRQGYGSPLDSKPNLKIKNPDAPVIDPEMPPATFVVPTNNEFPPSVVSAGGHRHVFIGTNREVAVEIPVSTHILHEPKCTLHSPAFWVIGGFDAAMRIGRIPLNAKYDRQTTYWLKNYCGTFNVDVMKADAKHPEWVFSINHCENKNEVVQTEYGTFYFHNNINLNDPAGPDTRSGRGPDGRYRDYQPAYFGLVTMSYAPVEASTHWGAELYRNDMGPVMWPEEGFLTPDGKAVVLEQKHPHPHPSSLIAEDPKDGRRYLYVFANISSTRPDRSSMIGACRSPIEARGLPGSYLNFYRGDYTEPSLPANMKEDVALLLTRKGGKADVVHPELYGINRFFVARLTRSGLFLSVESYSEGDYFQTALRLSKDLRSWGDRCVIPSSQINRKEDVTQTKKFGLFYPKFLSLDGSTHYDIDESQPFYIVATKPHGLVYRELSIAIE